MGLKQRDSENRETQSHEERRREIEKIQKETERKFIFTSFTSKLPKDRKTERQKDRK